MTASGIRQPAVPVADVPIGDLVRPELRGQEPYGAPQLDVPVRLNTNENPYPPDPATSAAVARAVAEAAADLHRYPDREATRLRTALAGHLTADTGVPLDARQVWAANGSNEVMQQLLQAFGGPGRLLLSYGPTYPMYPEYARNTGTAWRCEPRDERYGVDPARLVDDLATHRPAVVVLASPNNPTGTALPLATVTAALDAAPGLVVVDEAYAEFRRAGVPSAVELLDGHPRLVVVRTLSKAFAGAGARIGYLAADPAVVDVLRVVRLPYHLSALTQAAGCALLAHRTEQLRTVDALRRGRDDLVDWLRARGWTVPDSDANFVLVGPFDDARAVWERLVACGVLVREIGGPGRLRVSIGTPEEMAAFRAAFAAVTSAGAP